MASLRSTHRFKKNACSNKPSGIACHISGGVGGCAEAIVRFCASPFVPTAAFLATASFLTSFMLFSGLIFIAFMDFDGEVAFMGCDEDVPFMACDVEVAFMACDEEVAFMAFDEGVPFMGRDGAVACDGAVAFVALGIAGVFLMNSVKDCFQRATSASFEKLSAACLKLALTRSKCSCSK